MSEALRIGESLGASILIETAAIRPVFAAIMAEAPYADLRQIAEYRVCQMLQMPPVLGVPAAKVILGSAVFYARWRYGLDLARVSPVRAIAQASTPILLIHGLKDVRTFRFHSEELAKANPLNPLWLVPNAEHTGAAAAAPEEFRGRVLTWFARH